jgi:hypothetical protein
MVKSRYLIYKLKLYEMLKINRFPYINNGNLIFASVLSKLRAAVNSRSSSSGSTTPGKPPSSVPLPLPR